MKNLILFLFLLFSFPSYALSGSACNTIFRTSSSGCESRESSNTTGGSFPLLFDAFNFSPAALPTFNSPVGIEAYYSSSKINVALLKGFDGAGFGFTSKQSSSTFFSGVENYKVALANTNSNYNSNVLGKYINFGTALSTIKIPDFFSIPIGLSYKYNPETKKWIPNPGIEIRTPYLSFGLSYYKEKSNNYSDGFYDISSTDDVVSLNASTKIENFFLSYSLIQDKYTATINQLNTNTYLTNSSYTVTTNIISSTYVFNTFSMTAAYRTQSNPSIYSGYSNVNYKNNHFLIGGVLKTDNIEFGTYYNYVLNNDFSAILKLYF